MQALIIVDIQNDYFSGGTMPLNGSDNAASHAQKILKGFRDKQKPVIHIQHIATRADATFFLPDTVGAQIHASVEPIDGEAVFQKHYPNSFRETPLLKYLQDKGITQLVIIGMMTQMCIDTTVRAAFDLGFQCVVAHDACATRDLAFNGQTVSAKDVQVAYMAALNGLFAQVKSTEEVCQSI